MKKTFSSVSDTFSNRISLSKGSEATAACGEPTMHANKLMLTMRGLSTLNFGSSWHGEQKAAEKQKSENNNAYATVTSLQRYTSCPE